MTPRLPTPGVGGRGTVRVALTALGGAVEPGAGIVLDPSMTVGIPELDDDHRRLMVIIGRLRSTIASTEPGDRRRASVVAQALLEAAEAHFRREEGALRRMGYPRLKEHARDHEAALVMVEDLLRALADPADDGEPARACEDIFAYFVWLIACRDMDYVWYLADRTAARA